MKAQFITDTEGKKVGLLLSIKDYTKILQELEELDDIRVYDLAKKEDNRDGIPLSDYLKKRKRNGKVQRQLA